MTWMRLDSTVRTHPKIGRLARGLGVSRVQAIGHIVSLWTWVLEFASDGDLTAFDDADLAEAGCWEGDPGTFVSTLRSTLLVDFDPDSGTSRVHGWWERASQLKDAQRKRDSRLSRPRPSVSAKSPASVRSDEDGRRRTDEDGRTKTDGSIGGSEDRTSSPPPAPPEGGAPVRESREQLELTGDVADGRGVKAAATRALIDRVVEHYRSHHPQARPGERERKLIRARLAEGYSVEQLGRAIDGNTASPWHRGENDKSRAYQTLELVMRSSDKVNQFLGLAAEHCDELGRARASPVVSERTRRNVRAAEAWLEGSPDA